MSGVDKIHDNIKKRNYDKKFEKHLVDKENQKREHLIEKENLKNDKF